MTDPTLPATVLGLCAAAVTASVLLSMTALPVLVIAGCCLAVGWVAVLVMMVEV